MKTLISTLLAGAMVLGATAAQAEKLVIAGRDGAYGQALKIATEAFKAPLAASILSSDPQMSMLPGIRFKAPPCGCFCRAERMLTPCKSFLAIRVRLKW